MATEWGTEFRRNWRGSRKAVSDSPAALQAALTGISIRTVAKPREGWWIY